MSQHAGRLRAAVVAGLAALTVTAGCARPSAGPAQRAAASAARGSAARTASSTLAAPTSAASSTPVASPRGTPATRRFVAYRANGAPTGGVAAHRSGSCFTTSIIVADPHAYRCIAGNLLLDPCFASRAAAPTLACYADPWSPATVLTRTGQLPRAAPLHIARPWAVQLADGHRCVAVAGTTLIARGVALSYHCDQGTAGPLPPAGGSTQVLYRAPTGALRRVVVVTQWWA